MFEIIEDKTLHEVQARSAAAITDAMFNINPMLRLVPATSVCGSSAKEKIEAALKFAHQAHVMLISTGNVYADHSGNLEEAVDGISTAILDLQKHLQDIERGVE